MDHEPVRIARQGGDERSVDLVDRQRPPCGTRDEDGMRAMFVIWAEVTVRQSSGKREYHVCGDCLVELRKWFDPDEADLVYGPCDENGCSSQDRKTTLSGSAKPRGKATSSLAWSTDLRGHPSTAESHLEPPP